MRLGGRGYATSRYDVGAAAAQKLQGGKAAFINAEHVLDPDVRRGERDDSSKTTTRDSSRVPAVSTTPSIRRFFGYVGKAYLL